MSQIIIEFGVGKELRAARLKAELKISDIASELNLKVEHLTAIEKDNYNELPGSTYAIGFVRSYAKFLGLNDAHLVDRLIEGGFIDDIRVSKPIVDSDIPHEKDMKMIYILLISLSLIIACAYFYFTKVYESNDDALNTPVDNEITKIIKSNSEKNKLKVLEKKLDENKSLGNDSNSVSVVENLTENKDIENNKIKLVGTKPQNARVMLTAKEDVWFQVYNPKNKKIYMNSVLKAGNSIWLKPVKGAVIDIGRPHEINVTIDNKDYGISGPAWGGVIKKLPIDADYLIYDYYGKGINEKSYNRWLKNKTN